jgi:nitrate reductase alpha subunit
MTSHAAALDPAAAQQLVTRYATLLDEQTRAHALPAATTTLPASKLEIKRAIRVVFDALAATDQLTGDLHSFLEEAYVGLANYVDEELAALAAEHRRASEALEAVEGQPRDRFTSPHWTVVARTSRLAGEIARSSAQEAAALRTEFETVIAARRP